MLDVRCSTFNRSSVNPTTVLRRMNILVLVLAQLGGSEVKWNFKLIIANNEGVHYASLYFTRLEIDAWIDYDIHQITDEIE